MTTCNNWLLKNVMATSFYALWPPLATEKFFALYSWVYIYSSNDKVWGSPILMRVQLVLSVHWSVRVLYLVTTSEPCTCVLGIRMHTVSWTRPFFWYMRKLKGVGKEGKYSLVHETNLHMCNWDSHYLNAHCYNDILYQTPGGEVCSVTSSWEGWWWCNEGFDRERSWCQYAE